MSDTTSIEADIAAIKAQHDAAIRNRVRAEQARDQAAAQADALYALLQRNFGVDNLTDAYALLDKLDTDLAAHIATLRDQLKAAGGTA